MSTVHVSQALAVPKNLHTRADGASKRPLRPQRTEITPLYQTATNENTDDKNNTAIKLEPIGGDVLSLDLLNQYNEIVGPTESLAFKRLPPVKVSYQTTKHKFIESPHIEGTSRIIRPQLSMKTYSPGHHIFTEGISKSSLVRSPTFALQQVGVPYSNLPDNISIYKKKDKFAFGVKNGEYEKSPYRLTPRPFKIGSATFISALEPETEKSITKGDHFLKAKRGSKPSLDRPYLELRSNVIKLEPLATKEDKENKYTARNRSEFNTDIVNIPAGYTRPAMSPLAPGNSFYLTETEPQAEADVTPREIKEAYLDAEDKSVKLERQDRKLSVISIGETVAPSFYDNKKREARQQYPMYDNTARRNESYRRKKFEYSDDFTSKAKPHVPSSSFTYKVSMQGMSFQQDNAADMFKPIRNNLRDRNGNVIHKQRGLGRYKEEDMTKNNSDYNFRRYYRRVFRRPKSSDSLSTEFSQFPGNPPPSEISHILSEDAPLLVNDGRNGMVTLVEERTMTAASIISQRKENTPVANAYIKGDNRNITEINENAGSNLTNRTQEDTETCTDTDVQFENALRSIERYQEQEIESSRTETDKNLGVDNSLYVSEKTKELESIRSVYETSSKCDSSLVSQYIAEAEERIKSMSASEDIEIKPSHTISTDSVLQSTKIVKLDTIDENQATKKNVLVKSKLNPNKQSLAVPTLSLDSINYNPTFQISKERTSLSRSIQNMTINDETAQRNVPKFGSSLTSTITDKNDERETNFDKETKTTLQITRLRLFSGTSTVSVKAPSVNLTDENGEVHDMFDSELNDSKATDQSTKEKKVIINANIPFIYPSTNEVKAKRQ